jgi:hypothetical protein
MQANHSTCIHWSGRTQEPAREKVAEVEAAHLRKRKAYQSICTSRTMHTDEKCARGDYGRVGGFTSLLSFYPQSKQARIFLIPPKFGSLWENVIRVVHYADGKREKEVGSSIE